MTKQDAERVLRKVELYARLSLTVRCINFYGWSVILGYIPTAPKQGHR